VFQLLQGTTDYLLPVIPLAGLMPFGYAGRNDLASFGILLVVFALGESTSLVLTDSLYR